MATAGNIKVSVKEAIGNITIDIKVTGLRIARMRLIVAKWIIAVGCKVGGVGFNFEVNKNTG